MSNARLPVKPKPPLHLYLLRISPVAWQKFTDACRAQDKIASKVIRRLLADWTAAHGPEVPR